MLLISVEFPYLSILILLVVITGFTAVFWASVAIVFFKWTKCLITIITLKFTCKLPAVSIITKLDWS